MCFPGGSDDKESVCNAGDLGLIPGSGRFPGEGYGNPLQYSCLGNPMDRGVWQAPWGCKESDVTEFLFYILAFSFFIFEKGPCQRGAWRAAYRQWVPKRFGLDLATATTGNIYKES